MFKATHLFSAIMLGLAALSVDPAHAAKPVHQEGVVDQPFYVYISSLQDLTTDVVIHKTLFRDFDAIYTTVTLEVVQDSRGKLVGVAKVGSTEMTTINIPVSGQLKAKKGTVSLSLTGKTEETETVESSKLSLKSNLFRVDMPWNVAYLNDSITHRRPAPLLTDQSDAAGPATRVTEIIGPDSLLAFSSYRTSVNFSSPTTKYNFISDHVVKGFPLIEVTPALPEDIVGLSPKNKYFEVLVPFGIDLGTGVAALTPDNVAAFAVKANRIAVGFLGETWMGNFYADYVSGKIGPVKVSGQVNWPILPPS